MDGLHNHASPSVVEGVHDQPTATPPLSRLLSGPKGPHPAKGELADQLCLIERNGHITLYVVEGKGVEDEVLAYEDDLEAKSVRFELVTCSYTEMSARRDETINRADDGQRETQDASNADRQRHVMAHLKAAVGLGASDIHYTYEKGEGWSAQFRVNGDVEPPVDGGQWEVGQQLVRSLYNSMLENLSGDGQLNEFASQDGRLAQALADPLGLYGARIATRPISRGLYMAIRLLYDSGASRRSLSQLGYLPEQVESLTRMTHSVAGGIDFIVGATNSGKSTTLKVLLGQTIEHFQGRRNVLTLEDPIEYRIKGAKQTPVLNDDWEGGIRNLMRMDPDVVMIGEVRDEPSAMASLRAAITGHKVMTTIHANDAGTAIQRLRDMGVDEGLLFDHRAVCSFTAQSLVSVLCPHCRTPWAEGRKKQDEALVERVERHCNGGVGVFVRGPGCDRCRHTGWSDRRVIAEHQKTTKEYMHLFRRAGKAEAVAYWLSREGGIAKSGHLRRALVEGQIDPAIAESQVAQLDADLELVGEVQP